MNQANLGAATSRAATKPTQSNRTAQRDTFSAKKALAPAGATFDTAGELIRFSLSVFGDIPKVVRLYFSEVIRQAGILILSSGLVLWSFVLVVGMEIGLVGSVLLADLGASDLVGLFAALAVQATISPVLSWIYSAKVGCGYAAEIGTMRITEEIDALLVMGLHPRAYLVGTRLLATWIVFPFIFIIAFLIGLGGVWVINIGLLSTVSPGGFSDLLWGFLTPSGVLYVLIWGFVTMTTISLVSCYFGYTASGGPVGVGRGTQRSMVVNLVMASFYSALFYQLFFGLTRSLPIGN